MTSDQGGEIRQTPAAASGQDSAAATFWNRYYSAVPSVLQAPRLSYVPALDGIRALAVLAVLLYHAGYQWIPGGFLGVEIFFVLSGYLITSLLLSEWRSTGGVDLKTFWLRRARRLLPALYLLLIVALTYAVIALPNEVARLRADALAAVFYVTNWWLIFDHVSYFEAVGRPSLFEHLWSLAVEEQFYLIWPPLFVFGISRFRARRMLLGVVLGVVASTVLMAILYDPAVDPSRLYYGTDTRAAELLVGAALAFVWQPGRPVNWGGRLVTRFRRVLEPGRRASMLLEMVGVGALACLGIALWQLGEYSQTLYQGGFLFVALATAALIAVVVHPGSRLISSVLGSPPLRWVGIRSYGIYLWHWPVYMVTRPELDVPLGGLPLLALRVVLTLILVEISYRLVETPFRTGRVGLALKSLRGEAGEQPRLARAMWLGVSGTVAMSTVIVGILVALAHPAKPPSYLAVQEVHIVASPSPAGTPQPAAATPTWSVEPADARAVTPTPAAVPFSDTLPPSVSGSPTPAPSTVEPSAPAPTPSPTPTPAPTTTPTPTPAPASSPDVTAVGDSVMVGAASDLANDIPNLDLDAKVGMQVQDAIQILQSRLAVGGLHRVVVVDIGNNGPLTADEFDRIMQIAGANRSVIFLSVRVPRPWEDTNNQVIASGVARYANAFLIDWYGATANRPDLFWDDGIHLRPDGASLYAQLIAAAIASLN